MLEPRVGAQQGIRQIPPPLHLYRLLLWPERGESPTIIFTFAPQVRGNSTLTDYLRGPGVAGFIG